MDTLERDRKTSRISIARVAERAGVSIATVSRVVNGVTNKASDATVERVRRAVADLGYRPTSAGQVLRRRESRLVALMAANLANPTMAALAASAETALRERGLVTVLCDSHDRPDLQDEYLLEMQAHQVRGTVLLAAVASAGLDAALEAGEPLLFVGRRCPSRAVKQTAFIGVNNDAAGRDVARVMIERNLPRPAVIHGALTSSATAERVAGFRDELLQANHPLAPEAVIPGEGLDHIAIGYDGMARLLAKGAPPGAVFCSSDLIAFGAHRRALEAGFDEKAIMFIGFDDNPLNDWVAPWLNSVRVPYASVGPAVVRALEELWRGTIPASHLLDHSIVLRDRVVGSKNESKGSVRCRE